jgi:hypothetical protein
MMHASREMIVALLDVELDMDEAQRTERHERTCDESTNRLSEARETTRAFAAVLHDVDQLEPDAWQTGTDRPADVLVLPVAEARASRAGGRATGGSTAWRWAAGLLLSTAAAAAIIRPGFLEREAPLPAEPTRTVSAPAPADRPGGGVAVRPRDGVVEILLVRADAGTRIRVAFHDQADVVIDAFDGPAPAFAARDGRVAVYFGDRSATLDIGVPRSLRLGRIVAGDTELAVIREGRLESIRTEGPIVVERGAGQR